MVCTHTHTHSLVCRFTITTTSSVAVVKYDEDMTLKRCGVVIRTMSVKGNVLEHVEEYVCVA